MKKILIELLVLVVCVLCIVVPGVLLDMHSQELQDSAKAVPDSLYSAANMSMAKNASEKLSVKEKIQLINGEWASEIVENVANESNYAAFQVAELARNSIEKLYNEKKYPESIASNFANWYSWSAECSKAVDNVFHTYTVYYWKIIYEKYDHSEKHEIYIVEDGTIFYAEYDNHGEKTVYELEI